jgi:hypothetical protein
VIACQAEQKEQKVQRGDTQPKKTRKPEPKIEENPQKPNPQVAGGTHDPANPNPTPPTTPPKPNMPTPKRKRSPTKKTQMKTPRLVFTTNPENPKPLKTKPNRKPTNPHPNKNQQIFVKIDKEVHLIKHKGLATSTRKPNPKNPPTPEQIQETKQIPPTQPTNPCPPKKINKNFTDLIKMFQNGNSNPNQEHAKPTSGNIKPTIMTRMIGSHHHDQQNQNLTADENLLEFFLLQTNP